MRRNIGQGGADFMDKSGALDICMKYHEKPNHSEEEDFEYTEALSFLIEKTKDPMYMTELGAYYYGKKKFNLALKYYNLAAECGDEYAILDLGYIWYYGRTGVKDYEKAFKYYERAASMGNITARYKMADMYKNGYYVGKDYDKYKEIIESL